MSARCVVWVFSAAVWAAVGAFALSGCISGQPPGAGLDVGVRAVMGK